MPMQKPTYFTKVLQTLRQLSTTKGFSIKQITEQLRQLGIKRDLKEIKSIVEQSLKYGVKNKILQEKDGKYHLTVARLRSLHVKSSAQKTKKKHVTFKKSKTNVNGKSKRRNSSKNRKNSKTAKKQSPRSKKQSEEKNTVEPSEPNEQSDQRKSTENTPSETNSESGLKVENKESKEALDVTPEKDVHDNCVNKNRNRGKPLVQTPEPPRLESDPKLAMEPPRPPTRLTQRKSSRHSSKVGKELKHKYKHNCSHALERGKRLKDLIPDDKTYRKYKTCSRHHHRNSEESSDYDTKSFKEKTRRKCQHCRKGHYHHSHYNLDDYLLERKRSKTDLSNLDKSKTVVANLTPFEAFFVANHSKLETIAEQMSVEDDAEEVEDKTTRDSFGPSYIN